MDRFAVSVSTEQHLLGLEEGADEVETTVVITDRTEGVTLRLPLTLLAALANYLLVDDEEEEEELEEVPVPELAEPTKRMTVRLSQPELQ